MTRLYLMIVLVLLLLSVTSMSHAQSMPVDFFAHASSYDEPAGDSPINLKVKQSNIDTDGFVYIEDGHFNTKVGRIRFFGVNLTFSAMFPNHELAIKLADQLAGLGVNCVRIHHIDKQDIWGDRLEHGCDAFDANQMNRLDFFIAQLKARGIYINMNLHVSWNYRKTQSFDYPEYGRQHGRIKGFDLFMPELIGMQKQYAQMLLTHVNPYTKLAYCDDPVMAMVEVNNENGLTQRLMYRKMLDTLPKAIADVLRNRWQAYLKANDVAVIPDVLPTVASLKKNEDGLARYWVRFLYDLEKQYRDEMFAYVKQDCRVRVPVTGTQIDHTFASFADGYDYVDRHLYWKHPAFPNKSWDWEDYYIKNFSMVPSERGTFSLIAPTRIANKPFVISEYNHPFPLTYAAEAITMGAVLAKLQDYDGLFLFHFSNNLGSQKVDYFAVRFSELKLSLFPFAAGLLRNENVKPLAGSIHLPMGLQTEFSEARKGLISTNPYLNMLYYKSIPTQSLPMSALAQARIGLVMQHGLTTCPTDFNAMVQGNSDQRLTWLRGLEDYRQCAFSLNDPYAKAWIGWAQPDNHYNMGNVQLSNVHSQSGYFHFTMHNLDGAIGKAGRHLIILQSQHRYSNVEYLDYKTKQPLTVQDDPYGRNIMARNVSEQTQEYIESLDARITVTLDKPIVSTAVRVYALDAQGHRSTAVACRMTGSTLTFACERSFKTIRYVLEVD